MKGRLLPVLALAFGLVAGCYVVPETGRRSVIIPMGDEVQMGATEFANMKAKQKLSTNQADIARVERVGWRMAKAVGNRMPNAQWEFTVFDADDTVNAFALPGGKVGVYSGLLRLAKSDDELAFVIGHEIAHVTSRHGAERMTEAFAVLVGAVVVDESTKKSQNRDLLLAAYGLAGTLGTLKFSRSHESEADFVGLRYTAYAGYNPMAAIDFWRKMSEVSARSAKPPEFISTHPSDERRISALQAEMPSVLPIYEANRKSADER